MRTEWEKREKRCEHLQFTHHFLSLSKIFFLFSFAFVKSCEERERERSREREMKKSKIGLFLAFFSKNSALNFFSRDQREREREKASHFLNKRLCCRLMRDAEIRERESF